MMNACKEKLLWDKSLFWALHNLRGDFLTFKILTVNMAYLRAFGNLFMPYNLNTFLHIFLEIFYVSNCVTLFTWKLSLPRQNKA